MIHKNSDLVYEENHYKTQTHVNKLRYLNISIFNFMFDPVVMFARKQYLLSLFLYTLHRIQH